MVARAGTSLQVQKYATVDFDDRRFLRSGGRCVELMVQPQLPWQFRRRRAAYDLQAHPSDPSLE